MRRVAFAWITEYIDFSTDEEGIKWIKENAYSYRFVEGGGHVEQGWRVEHEPIEFLYSTGNDEYPWSVHIEKPYRQYNFG